MGAVLSFSTALESITCCECGMPFAFPTDMLRRRRETGGAFYCPSGHRQSFKETEVARLQRQIAAEKARADREAERASRNWQEKEAADRREAAARGQVTTMRRRVGHGVCPCCKRTVRQLAAHMQSKHPEFAASEPTP